MKVERVRPGMQVKLWGSQHPMEIVDINIRDQTIRCTWLTADGRRVLPRRFQASEVGLAFCLGPDGSLDSA